MQLMSRDEGPRPLLPAQGEWAALMLSEAGAVADTRAYALALRACALSGSWREAADVLDVLDSCATHMPPAEIEAVSRCSPFTRVGFVDAGAFMMWVSSTSALSLT